LFLLITAVALGSGCPRQQPTPPAAIPKPTAEEVKERLAKEFAVVYLILPKTDAPKSDNLLDELKPLLDEQANTRMETTGSGYLRQVNLAPVKDVEALGMKQKLGRVLAYDPAKRALLIEQGVAPGTRETWKDAAYLDRQVTARKARWGLEGKVRTVSKEHPGDQVVCVRIRGDFLKDDKHFLLGVADLRPKLAALLYGPADKRSVYGMEIRDGEMATVIAPVKDLEALTKKIDFADVLFYDTEHNVVILEVPGKVASKK